MAIWDAIESVWGEQVSRSWSGLRSERSNGDVRRSGGDVRKIDFEPRSNGSHGLVSRFTGTLADQLHACNKVSASGQQARSACHGDKVARSDSALGRGASAAGWLRGHWLSRGGGSAAAAAAAVAVSVASLADRQSPGAAGRARSAAGSDLTRRSPSAALNTLSAAVTPAHRSRSHPGRSTASWHRWQAAYNRYRPNINTTCWYVLCLFLM